MDDLILPFELYRYPLPTILSSSTASSSGGVILCVQLLVLEMSSTISLALILGFTTMMATPPFRVLDVLIASPTLMLGLM